MFILHMMCFSEDWVKNNVLCSHSVHEGVSCKWTSSRNFRHSFRHSSAWHHSMRAWSSLPNSGWTLWEPQVTRTLERADLEFSQLTTNVLASCLMFVVNLSSTLSTMLRLTGWAQAQLFHLDSPWLSRDATLSQRRISTSPFAHFGLTWHMRLSQSVVPTCISSGLDR